MIKNIQINWHIEDIKYHARDVHNITITDEEAAEILVRMKNKHDASIGINWDVIDYYVSDLIDNNKE